MCLLLIANCALSTAANAAESYDLTNCGASVVTTISSSDELTFLGIDAKGIGRSNTASKAFDNATYQCVSVVSIAGTQRNGMGYCLWPEPRRAAPRDHIAIARRLGVMLAAWPGQEG